MATVTEPARKKAAGTLAKTIGSIEGVLSIAKPICAADQLANALEKALFGKFPKDSDYKLYFRIVVQSLRLPSVESKEAAAAASITPEAAHTGKRGRDFLYGMISAEDFLADVVQQRDAQLRVNQSAAVAAPVQESKTAPKPELKAVAQKPVTATPTQPQAQPKAPKPQPATHAPTPAPTKPAPAKPVLPVTLATTAPVQTGSAQAAAAQPTAQPAAQQPKNEAKTATSDEEEEEEGECAEGPSRSAGASAKKKRNKKKKKKQLQQQQKAQEAADAAGSTPVELEAACRDVGVCLPDCISALTKSQAMIEKGLMLAVQKKFKDATVAFFDALKDNFFGFLPNPQQQAVMLDCVLQSMKIFPDIARSCHTLLGRLNWLQGNVRQSSTHLNMCITLTPDNDVLKPTLLAALAITSLFQQEHKHALRCASLAVGMLDKNASLAGSPLAYLYFVRGCVMSATGDFTRAQFDLEKFIRAVGRKHEDWFLCDALALLAAVRLRRKKQDGAMRTFELSKLAKTVRDDGGDRHVYTPTDALALLSSKFAKPSAEVSEATAYKQSENAKISSLLEKKEFKACATEAARWLNEADRVRALQHDVWGSVATDGKANDPKPAAPVQASKPGALLAFEDNAFLSSLHRARAECLMKLPAPQWAECVQAARTALFLQPYSGPCFETLAAALLGLANAHDKATQAQAALEQAAAAAAKEATKERLQKVLQQAADVLTAGLLISPGTQALKELRLQATTAANTLLS